MSEVATSGPTLASVEAVLRGELAHGDAILATTRPVLRHLIANEGQALFSDEVVARVRGMIGHVARQMLLVAAEEAGVADRGGFADDHVDAVAGDLLEEPALLGFAHALTIEAQIALRLQQRSGIDLVLSPLVQELAASSDHAVAGSAMRLLSAQARFMQAQRRMELPISDLPGRLLDTALTVLRRRLPDAAEGVEAKVRTLAGASQPRTEQTARLVSAMQNRARRALEVDHAGVAIFLSALALACDQDRDTVVMSLAENQVARLALSLRAAGLGQAAVEEQFLYLHPDITLPEGFEMLRADRAAALLAREPGQSSER